MTSSARTLPLIDLIDGAEPDNVSLKSVSLEAAFLIPGDTRLQLDTTHWEHKAADYLARAVARNPGNLRAHVQRALLHLKLKNTLCLYGSLLDLFIALGEHGHNLKIRMLLTTGDQLQETHRDFLLSRLQNVILANEVLDDTQCAVLPKGYSGTDTLILATTGGTDSNPLEQARLLLSHGQAYEAQQLLEPVVIKNPNSRDLHALLLEIYEQTGDKDAFDVTLERLRQENSDMTGLWQARSTSIGRAH